MTKDIVTNNPFIVTTPEDMSANDAFILFVDVFSDFPKILEEGHSFLHGPRGSGKSMMFRYLKPDCQLLRCKSTLAELPFYSIYIRVKNTELHLSEMQRLDGKHATYILNEHFMVIHFAVVALGALANDCELIDETDKNNLEATSELFDSFILLLEHCGWDGSDREKPNFANVSDIISSMINICESIYSEVKRYCKRIAFSKEIIPYEDALCGYLDFLFPLLKKIKKLPFMPKGAIYLLVDDADNLSVSQTKILNSWVFTRSSSDVSLKISTQQNYSTYTTPTGARIETPHDYSEVNISTVYTASNKDKYRDRIRAIVKKRLVLSGIEAEPEDFFPENVEQETRIKQIGEEIRKRWEKGEGRGYRAQDDVDRYARPDYIKSLAGSSKKSSTYSYAGFDQLIHLSSGIVRYFLDSAKNMYADVMSTSDSKYAPHEIPHSIQNRIVRKDADDFFFGELNKKRKEEGRSDNDLQISQLSNLITGLGGMFRAILISNRSERKVFSFAISDEPSKQVSEIIQLGVNYGYLQLSTIGKKEKKIGGRTRLYILNRRLAPNYTLDPTGFAGYQFLQNHILEEFIKDPEKALRKLINKKKLTSEEKNKQMSILDY